MLVRRLWPLAIVATVLAWHPGGHLPTAHVHAQQGNSNNSAEQLGERNIAPLSDQLTQGLRAVTPEQKRFVAVTVAYVDQGVIPRAMVNLVYRWAIERNANVPFPYFEYAMRTLSKRRGIILP